MFNGDSPRYLQLFATSFTKRSDWQITNRSVRTTSVCSRGQSPLFTFKNTKEILPNYSGNIVFNSISNSEKLYKTSIKCPVSPYEDELQELRKNNSKIKEMIRRKYE